AERLLRGSAGACISRKAVDIHAQRAIGEAAVFDMEVAAGAEGEVQRQQVLLAGMAAPRMGRPVAVVEQGGAVADLQLRHHPVAELAGPGFDYLGSGTPVQLAEVVGDAARADQQYALSAQRREGLADPYLQLRAGMAGQ